MKNTIQNPFYKPLTPENGVISIVKEWFYKEKKGDVSAREDASLKLEDYLVKTGDGTFTLRSNVIDAGFETMHTNHGAYLEAQKKFVKPAGLKGKKNVSILDICSGLGINSAALLDELLDKNDNPNLEKIKIDMVEISTETLAASLLIPNQSTSHDLISRVIENYLIENGIIKYPKIIQEIPDLIEINIYFKDARQMVSDVHFGEQYDAIFLDPFSPGKSPELYSYDFISKLSSLLYKDGLILTYTSSAPVRYALMCTGLEVGEGPVMGRSGGTVASHNPKKIIRPLNVNDERMIALSDSGIPFRDPELSATGEIISKKRQKERISSRGITKMASTVKTPVFLTKNLDEQKNKRRILNNLKKFGIDNPNSKNARFLVCPQYEECICGCGKSGFHTSRERVMEMEKRLKFVVSQLSNQ